MEIKAAEGNLALGSLFKPIAIGYAIGASAIFIPILLLMVPTFFLAPGVVDQNGQLLQGPGPIWAMVVVPMLIIFPIVIALQGVLIGGAIILGLKIYRTRKPIRVVIENQAY